MIKGSDNQLSYEDLLLENARLKAELNQLRRLVFGQKRERFIPILNSEQMVLAEVDQLEKAESTCPIEQISYTRRKPVNHQPVAHGRQTLPADLPRKEIVIMPDENVTGMKKIGEEITEELEYKPGTFYVNRYIRPKFARPKDEGVVIGTLPSRPIDKGIAGPGLLAHILINKYIDHLPLYRQWKRFLRQNVDIPVSTLSGWVQASAELLRPLYELQKEQVLNSAYLMADETTIKVLDQEKRGTTHTGYYWVYYAPLLRQVFFDYRDGRGRAGPLHILHSFQGHLQSDGYAGYEPIAQRQGVMPLACMAHARRYFFEAQPTNSEYRIWMLEHIQTLYEVERQAREGVLSYDERYRLRQSQSVPVLDVMEKWLHENSTKVLPKSKLGEAMGYMLNRWERLRRYTTDGRLEIDNNLVENAIRPIALGRKNYLFAGSHEGAERAAIIYTFVANAGLQGKEPFAYLRDVLRRIADHPYRHLADLLASNWQSLPE